MPRSTKLTVSAAAQKRQVGFIAFATHLRNLRYTLEDLGLIDSKRKNGVLDAAQQHGGHGPSETTDVRTEVAHHRRKRTPQSDGPLSVGTGSVRIGCRLYSCGTVHATEHRIHRSRL